jgi:hypothetical protein
MTLRVLENDSYNKYSPRDYLKVKVYTLTQSAKSEVYKIKYLIY